MSLPSAFRHFPLKELDHAKGHEGRSADVILAEGEWDPRILGLVKSGGVLLWAFENPLSLRTFAGARSTGSDQLFDFRGATWRERREHLADAGWTLLSEYLLFPTLAEAKTMISRDLAISAPIFAARMGGSTFSPLNEMPRLAQFPESLTLVRAARAGILPELAPAGVLLATRSPDGAIARCLMAAQNDRYELAWHESSGRRIPCRTVIRQSQSGLVSDKIALDNLDDSPRMLQDRTMAVEWLSPRNSAVTDCQPLTELLHEHLHSRDWTAFESELTRFIQDQLVAGLQPESLDATLVNAVRNENGQWAFFDLEWKLGASMSTMTPSWYVFRNVLVLARNFEFFTAETPFRSLRELYERLCRTLGVAFDFEADLRQEAHFQGLVSKNDAPENHAKQLRATFDHRFAAQWFPFRAEIEARLRVVHPELVSILDTLPFKALKRAFRIAGRFGPGA